MTPTYQWHLVALSVAVAIVASYTTLRLVARLVWAAPSKRPLWIVAGAASMGIGIWAMHFVGMLALVLPVPVFYDQALTLWSIVPAFLACMVAMWVLGSGWRSRATSVVAALLMATGIVAMHYTGMAAMRMQPPITYDPWLFVLSLTIAGGASWGALVLGSRERAEGGVAEWGRIGGSIVMGLAIVGMHYVGMAAAQFSSDAVCGVTSTGFGGAAIGLFVGLGAVVILLFSLALTFFDEMVGENSFYKALLEAQSDAGAGVLLVESGRIIYSNAALLTLSGYTDFELKALPDWRHLIGGAERQFPTRVADQAGVELGRREATLYRRDGTSCDCEIVSSAFRHGDRIRQLMLCLDISDRKRNEAALREKDAQTRELALVAASTDNGVVIMDTERRITWANDGFLRMSGYELDEAIGKRPGQLLDGEATDAETTRFIQDQLAKGQRFETEIIHYHKSGRPYWAVIAVDAIYDESGRVSKYISVERDITRRKEADVALRLSEMRLKEAQELAHVGNWELDLATDEYFLSEEALRIHELASTNGRVARAVLANTLHPEDLQLIRRKRMEAEANLGTYSNAVRLVFEGGRTKYVQIRGAVHGDARGTPNRIAGTVQDITEQKRAEQALVDLNETLEAKVLARTRELDRERKFQEVVVNATGALVFVLDRNGHFVQVNDAFERLTGFRQKDLKGTPFWESVIPVSRRAQVKARHQSLTPQAKLNRDIEVAWVARNGRPLLISLNNAVLLDEHGDLEFIVASGIDVTERKRVEKALIVSNESLNRSVSRLRETQSQLVQAEKMASLGALVAGISHEINTPLGIGVTSATTLQEELVALKREFDSGTMTKSALERYIERGLEACGILVRNLLRAAELIRSFKQVAVDQSSGEKREINIANYVDEVVRSLQPRLKGTNIRVVNDSQPDLSVVTYPGALYQVLSNLLMNSLVHAYEEGQTGTIRIDARREGSDVLIDFSDDGKGISPDIRDKIFDPFFTTRRGSGGSGLGLHIVFNQVAGTLNGAISLLPRETRGATFRIRFPLMVQE